MILVGLSYPTDRDCVKSPKIMVVATFRLRFWRFLAGIKLAATNVHGFSHRNCSVFSQVLMPEMNLFHLWQTFGNLFICVSVALNSLIMAAAMIVSCSASFHYLCNFSQYSLNFAVFVYKNHGRIPNWITRITIT